MPSNTSRASRNHLTKWVKISPVRETQDLARSQLRASILDESTKKAIAPIIKGCKEKASALNDIFQEIDRKKKHDKEAKDWPALVSFYRTLLLRLGKAHRVETLMQDILNGLKGLVVHQLFKVATRHRLTSWRVLSISYQRRSHPSRTRSLSRTARMSPSAPATGERDGSLTLWEEP